MNRSRLEWVAVLALLGGLIAAVAWHRMTYVPQGTFAVDTVVTRYRVEQLGQRLADADRTGDRQAAAAMFGVLGDSLRALNERPGIATSALHNCRVALVHVTEGAAAVADGNRWFGEERFRAALKAC